MIVDTSAIVAIALQEPGFEELLAKLAKAQNTGVGVPTLVETAIVLSARLRQDARGILSRLPRCRLEMLILRQPSTLGCDTARDDTWPH